MRRGIYSANCGYFSGITLAVLVGKICQENDMDAACLLYKFFETFSESGWREPVQMQLDQQYKKQRGVGLRQGQLQAIDQYSQDVMVVLTPNDQFRNTAYRVGEHNYDTIC